jgi:hypothetical protein
VNKPDTRGPGLKTRSDCGRSPTTAVSARRSRAAPQPRTSRDPQRYTLERRMRDDLSMNRYRLLLVVVLVVSAAALSACGSSGSSSSSSTSTSGSGGAAATAKQKCLDQTKKIQNSTARSTAEQACRKITTGNANVNAALKKAKQSCLSAAQSIPIDSIKKAAESQCQKISGS